MIRVILVAAVLFALLANPAVALTGNELRQWCNQQGDLTSEAFCLGYVVVIRDIVPEDCVPQTVTNAQLVDVVRKYLEANPENRDGPGAWLIFSAAGEAYHCTGRSWVGFCLEWPGASPSDAPSLSSWRGLMELDRSALSIARSARK